jgi:hypothetical protein
MLLCVFIISSYVTIISTKNQHTETDKEICSSTGLECGVDIRITSESKDRIVKCDCDDNQYCNLKSFTCNIHKIIKNVTYQYLVR